MALLGALSGELHGGANVEVMKMLFDIHDSQNIEKWIQDKLKEGKRIMGMGHAVYRTTDPRADILERLSTSVCKNDNYKWYEITRQVEQYTNKVHDRDQKTTNLS